MRNTLEKYFSAGKFQTTQRLETVLNQEKNAWVRLINSFSRRLRRLMNGEQRDQQPSASGTPIKPTESTPPTSYMVDANTGRDYEIYNRGMDAGLEEKKRAIDEHFPIITDTSVIMDVGSGTGALAQRIAEDQHQKGVHPTVVALDISHEYVQQTSEQVLITLAFGDIAELTTPDNSVDVFYLSTSMHEVASYGGGRHRITEAFRNMYRMLKPGGRIIVRDFVRPTMPEQGLSYQDEILMELSTTGASTPEASENGVIDYSKLSHFALFQQFHREFKNPDPRPDGQQPAFSYEVMTIDGKQLIKVPFEWAYEFYMRKEYTRNWRNEIHEKYSFFTLEEMAELYQELGFTDIKVEPNPNHFITHNWLKGKVGLYTLIDGKPEPITDFPPTHMVASASKPGTLIQTDNDGDKQAQLESLHIPTINYEALLTSVDLDLEKGSITFNPWQTDGEGVVRGTVQTFEIDTTKQPIRGKKFSLYALKNQPDRVIKIPNTEVKDWNVVRQDGVVSSLSQAVDRQEVLDEHAIPHLQVFEKDADGPPYRFLIQQAVPDDAVSAAQLIAKGELMEADIQQLCSYVAALESRQEYQVDTNPFSWFRVKKSDGTTELKYTSAKVYPYDERWRFSRIGLLQWTDPQFVENATHYLAKLPKKQQQKEFTERWLAQDSPTLEIWKRFLPPSLWPDHIL